MTAKNMNRRRFLGTSARTLGAIPLVLDPLGKTLIGQTVPSTERALRFISIFTPQVPFTYKEGNNFANDIWFQVFWEAVTDPLVRSATRFFPQFSYNVIPKGLHELGYVASLTGGQYPNIEDYNHSSMGGQVNPGSVVDYPINSLDQRIAQIVNNGYAPVFDVTNQLALLMSEMSNNLTSDGYYFTTHSERNFLDFVSFDSAGRTRVPWNDPSSVLERLFAAVPDNPDQPPPPPPPEPVGASAAVERILQHVHGTEISRYISSRSLQQAENSYQNLDHFRIRLEELRNRTGSGGGGGVSQIVGCQDPAFSAPGRLPVGTDGRSISTAQMDTSLDFHFEALLQCMRCDLTRVSNFLFSNWEDGCVGASYPGTAGPINVHNEGSHYEGSFGSPNSSNRVTIGHVYRYWYGKIGAFLSRMAAEADPVAGDGSSLLDNSVVYIASQGGSHIEWGTHQMNNTAIAVVGGGRSQGGGQNLLPALTSNDVMGHVFDGSGRYPELRGATVNLTRPAMQVRGHNYDGGDLVSNLQLTLLRLFDPTVNSHGSDDLSRSRTSLEISTPAEYTASR